MTMKYGLAISAMAFSAGLFLSAQTNAAEVNPTTPCAVAPTAGGEDRSQMSNPGYWHDCAIDARVQANRMPNPPSRQLMGDASVVYEMLSRNPELQQDQGPTR